MLSDFAAGSDGNGEKAIFHLTKTVSQNAINQRNAIPAKGIKFIASVTAPEFVRSHAPDSCGSSGTEARMSQNAAIIKRENSKPAMAAALGVRKPTFVTVLIVAIIYLLLSHGLG